MLKKHREIISYLFFGVLTTIVSIAVYHIMNLILGEDLYLISNIISWIIAVAFAFITNKLFVFSSKSFEASVLIKEIPSFVAARLFSLVLEEIGLFLLIDILSFDEKSLNVSFIIISGALIAKLIMQIIVIIANYIFSKFFIFKKNSK